MNAATLPRKREAKVPCLKTWFPSAVAREVIQTEDGGPLWEAEWDQVLMLHWSLPPAVLQGIVPFPLDLREGRAWISAVAFHLRGMRLPWLRAGLSRIDLPFTHHPFLNLRTYVKAGDEAGIFFLREWVPLMPSIALSRPLYGLPFSAGKMDIDHPLEGGHASGIVTSGGQSLSYEADIPRQFDACEAGSLTEFLMERYTAFTEWRGWKRLFHVWHPPWQQAAVDAEVGDSSLFDLTGKWPIHARFEGAHYSPGLPSVWMGAPRAVN